MAEDVVLGIRCPECKGTNVMVKDSRPIYGGRRRRRYECLDCKSRFFTIELQEKLYKSAFACANKYVALKKEGKIK